MIAHDARACASCQFTATSRSARRVGVEPFAVELRVFAGRPQILQRKIDLVAQSGVSLPHADAERLDAEQVADDLEVRIALAKPCRMLRLPVSASTRPCASASQALL